ncbi:MAG: TrkH family potassium uptake protein [Planctomycetota bacterium]|jgi:trk system potassium uptake protein TrkH
MIEEGRVLSPVRRWRITLWLDVVLALSGLVAIAALILEYGFEKPPIEVRDLHIVESIVVAIFVLDRVLHLALAARRREYVRRNLIDFILIIAAVGVFAGSLEFRGDVLSAGALYVIITQVYLLVALIIRAVNMNLRFAGSGIHPTWLLVGSFAFLSLAGSGLLMLPAAVRYGYERWSYPDALFTAVSATCVTGLVVRDTGTHFTGFGQAVILTLIQLGGLGIMMFGTVLAMLVGKGLSVRTSNTIGHMLATERIGELGRTLKFVALVTIAFELIGILMFYPMFANTFDAYGARLADNPGRALWHSLFHSISSFCNAGFALYKSNMMHGVDEAWPSHLRNNWQIVGVMAPLIVIGGLGFPVLQDCARWFRARLRGLFGRGSSASGGSPGGPRARLSLHSKVVLTTSAALIVFGAVGLAVVEKLPGNSPPNSAGSDSAQDPTDTASLRNLDGGRLVKAAAFQSVTARTAGFNTVDMKKLSHSGKLWLCGLMVIGGSPASTAGGMKTATFALLIIATYCMLRRRSELEVFRRSISVDLLRKTVTVAVLYLALVATVTLLLSIGMKQYKEYDLIDLLFEACSACGTVGLSTGVTPKLPVFPKLVVTAGMFIGRLGPLTLLLALTSKMRYVRYSYPTENVVIG